MNDRASTDWDAIVIGAGPAGAMTSLLLAREGLATLLVERKAFPRHKVCGGCLNAHAVAALGRAGLVHRIVRAGARPIDRFVVRHEARSVAVDMPAGLAVSRATLDAVLVESAVEAGCTFQPETAALVAPESPAPAREDWRGVTFGPVRGGPPVVARGRVVIAADGLAHSALSEGDGFKSIVWAGSRIGLGGVTPARVVDCGERAILMAVGPTGYVGVVEVEDGMLNIAAAVDPGALRGPGGAAAGVAAILEASGVAVREPLDRVTWLGTVPLTRRMVRPAGRRVLVVGDAAGYVEPFTGEGMAWALAAAEAVVPFVLEGQGAWSEALERRWLRTFGRVVGREQRWCRFVSRGVRHPGVVRLAMAALRAEPRLARPVLSHLTPGVRGS